MIFKHYFILIILFFSFQSVVSAQIHGLSIIDTADPPGKGTMHVAGSAFVGETSKLYGGRFAYGVSERLLVFADIGVHDADFFDPETLGQAGMRYTLPLNLPFDLAIRATTIPYISSYEHYVEFTLGLLASRYLDSGSIWAVYASSGLDRQWWELMVPIDSKNSYIDKGNSTDLSFSLGITRKLTNASRFFLEAASIDEFYGCSGIRFEL